ncbi:MAG TPA: hypothetical protein VJX67_16395 [Blastocatellia bacterium]|nr:hypothetical protein [Blastocatellia bacterium]
MRQNLVSTIVVLFCSSSMATVLPGRSRVLEPPRSTTAFRSSTPATFGSGWQVDDDEREVYTGTVVAIGERPGTVSATFTLRITGHTSDDEAQRHLTTLAERGQDNLLKEISGEDLGTFTIGGRLGPRINVVREREVDGRRRIRVVFARWLRMAELRGGYRSVDYPFGFIELFINQNGKGEGTYIGAARLRWARDEKSGHQVEIENFGTYPAKLMGVTRRR